MKKKENAGTRKVRVWVRYNTKSRDEMKRIASELKLPKMGINHMLECMADSHMIAGLEREASRGLISFKCLPDEE